MALKFCRSSLLKHCFHNFTTFRTATASNTSRSNIQADNFRSSKTDPGEHTLADVGKFYKIPYELAFENLFKEGGWTRNFKENCETFSEACIMIREPGLEIIHYLKNADYNRPINKYVLYGRKGSGKSVIMSYLVHYAYLHKWLIVHLPWVPAWLSRPKEITVSQTRPGFIDLNARAAQWLLHFKLQNGAYLSENELLVQNDYQWNIRESTKAGDSILKVVEYGIARGSFSSEVILAILKEIKELCRQGKTKCLVFIDGFNALFHSKSKIKDSERNIVPPDKVSVLNAFKELAVSDWHNGAVVLTADSVAVLDWEESYLPLYQLTPKGYEYIYPFVPVEVPRYTQLEINNMLRYYVDRRWLRDERGFDELKALSGNNGYELMRICASL